MSEFFNECIDFATTYVVIPVVLTAQALFGSSTLPETLPSPEPLPLAAVTTWAPVETEAMSTFPQAPTCEFLANPTSITQGEEAILSWNTENAYSVVVSEGVGVVDLDGSASVAPSVTTMYTLTALSPYGWVTCTAAVVVKPAERGCSFAGAPIRINDGESATLTWATRGVTSIFINEGIGAVSPNDSRDVSPHVTTTYTLTASDSYGQLVCLSHVTITVIPNMLEPECTLDALPGAITMGESAMLTWTTDRATNVSINPHVGPVSASGNTVVSPLARTNYVLTASGPGGTTLCEKIIKVSAQPPETLPFYDLAARGCTIPTGGSSCPGTITWSTANAVDQITILDNGMAVSHEEGRTDFPRTWSYGSHDIILTDGGVPKKSQHLSVSCEIGLSWSGTKCEYAGVGIPPTLEAAPRFVTSGAPDAVTVNWNTNGVPETDCTLTGGGLSDTTLGNGSLDEYSGTARDTAIGQTTYTLTCNGASATAIVNVMHSMWEM